MSDSHEDRKWLLLQSASGNSVKYMELARPVHEAYAKLCGADYRYFEGRVHPKVHPAWNRLPLILEAFKQGYTKVVWMDSDVLVVKPERNIFAETSNTVPMLIPRSPSGTPWRGRGMAVCTGVMVLNRCIETTVAVEWVWSKRFTPLLPHHHPTMWENNWVADYVQDHPQVLELLDPRWNWKPNMVDDAGRPSYHPAHQDIPESECIIRAWHGQRQGPRWESFQERYRKLMVEQRGAK